MKVFTNFECLKDGSIMIGLIKDVNVHQEKHLHEFIEFVYVVDGEIVHYVNGEEFISKKGSLLVIQKGETHEFTNLGGGIYINLHIVPEKINGLTEFYSDLNRILKKMGSEEDFRWEDLPHFTQFGGIKMIEIENLLRYMIHEINSRSTGYEMVLKECLFILIMEIERKHHEAASDVKTYYGSIKFFEIKKYIDENYCNKVTLVNIAKEFYCSPVYLGRLFKKCVGVSFIEYIRDKRIEKSIEYLVTTNIAIEEIVTRVGYSDKTQFYCVFEKYTGKTPKKFRDDSTRFKNVFYDMYKR